MPYANPLTIEQRENRNLRQRERRLRDRDRILAKRRADYAENPEAGRQGYYKKLEKNPNWSREYYLKNRVHILSERKKLRDSNIEHTRSWFRAYHKRRAATDIQFRLAHNLRTRLHSAISNNSKAGSAVRDLGCSMSELKIHLSSKFLPDMTWENYGEWHIDHIVPLSRVDLTDRTQFLSVCHYTNLQPMWAKDNISKGNKLCQNA